MRLLAPGKLEWLLILPALVACWIIEEHYRYRMRLASPIATRFLGLSRRSSSGTRAATLLLALICAGAMVFALARPQVIVATRDPQFERQDLVIVLDRSVSMRAADVPPSRLVRATSEIRNFLRQRPDAIDRVALVGFADASLVLSYPTADVGSLFFYLDWINDDPTPLFGTNMGGALIKALDLVQKDPRKTRKIVLLISDGDDLGSDLDDALTMYRAARIPVHCLGIGGDVPVAIPVGPLKVGPPGVESNEPAVQSEEQGLEAARRAALEARGEQSTLRDEEDQPIITRYSESTLRRIAETTGGRYFRSSTGSEMASEINTIVRGERRFVGWKISTGYRDWYDACLAVALASGAALWLFL